PPGSGGRAGDRAPPPRRAAGRARRASGPRRGAARARSRPSRARRPGTATTRAPPPPPGRPATGAGPPTPAATPTAVPGPRPRAAGPARQGRASCQVPHGDGAAARGRGPVDEPRLVTGPVGAQVVQLVPAPAPPRCRLARGADLPLSLPGQGPHGRVDE